MDFISKEMVEGSKLVGHYGVGFLDDYLLGIKKSDFVMIGAPTGTGKSNLAYQIAFDNSEKLNVHLFALEADNNEPFRRRLFSEYSRALKASFSIYADYRKFVQGHFENKELLAAIEKQLMEKYYKLAIHYRDKQFSIETLAEKLNLIAKTGGCDMIILDHVDYFDIIADVNENYQVSEIMKTLRDINIEWEIPIILVSHLRKKSNRKVKIPEIEDLFGTSNKQKQMKTVILLAPDFESSKPDDGLFSTFFCIPKDRLFGGTHLIGRTYFNNNLGAYEKPYEILLAKNYGETVEKYEGRIPKWSKYGA